jgi:hypothetical protein
VINDSLTYTAVANLSGIGNVALCAEPVHSLVRPAPRRSGGSSPASMVPCCCWTGCS